MVKSIKYAFSFLLVMTVFASNAREDDEKRKFVEESYQVSSSTALKIENKFGDVEVNTWAKSEFSIKVEIIGKGRNEERAQRILDGIDIRIRESDSQISFETESDDMKTKNEEGFEVNYTIYMPEENPLNIKNRFGDTSMGNRLGDLDINVAYGSMKVGDVEGETYLKLSFGEGSIGSVDNGDFTIKYSKFEIESANNLDLTQGFSDIEIDDVKDLELESKYGSMEIKKAHKIDADVHFSGFEIEELTGSLELDCSYIGDFQIERLASSFTLVDIDGKFGSYEIGLAPNINADIDASFSFADLKVSSDVDVTFSYRVKESNSATYKGKIGKGDPNKRIKVDSGYGNLRLKMD
ncbi:MAG: DUF4097 family beta strand repeat-containing protein [Ekhidna sp.]